MRRFTTASLALTIAATGVLAGAAAVVAQDEPEWKIGVVTDVGSIDDRDFNQFTYEGAKAGAAAAGLAEPAVAVPKDESEYGQLIEAFVADGNNIIVTTGFALATDTTVAAKANPDVWFIGVDQDICVTRMATRTTRCLRRRCCGPAAEPRRHEVPGGPGRLPGRHGGRGPERERRHRGDRRRDLLRAVREVHPGLQARRQAVNPDIQVFDEWVTDSDITAAFYDQPGGTLFAEALIEVSQPDVIFQVAGQTGLGAIDAACDAGLYAIGVDVDQYETSPEGQACIVTSAEKKLTDTTSQTIQDIAAGTAAGGTIVWDAASGGVGDLALHPAGRGLA